LQVRIFLLMYQVWPHCEQTAFSPVPLVETGADSDDSSCGHTPTATKSKLVRLPIDSDIPAFNRCCSAAFFDPVVVPIALPCFISLTPFSFIIGQPEQGSKFAA